MLLNFNRYPEWNYRHNSNKMLKKNSVALLLMETIDTSEEKKCVSFRLMEHTNNKWMYITLTLASIDLWRTRRKDNNNNRLTWQKWEKWNEAWKRGAVRWTAIRKRAREREREDKRDRKKESTKSHIERQAQISAMVLHSKQIFPSSRVLQYINIDRVLGERMSKHYLDDNSFNGLPE